MAQNITLSGAARFHPPTYEDLLSLLYSVYKNYAFDPEHPLPAPTENMLQALFDEHTTATEYATAYFQHTGTMMEPEEAAA